MTTDMIIAALIGGLVGIVIGYFVRRTLGEGKIGSAEKEAKRIVSDAKKQAEARFREVLLEAKEEVHRMRTDFERDSRERRVELQNMERRLMQKEENLDRKAEVLEERSTGVAAREQRLSEKEAELESLHARQLEELQRISGMTQDEARKQVIRSIEDEARAEAAQRVRQIEMEAREEGERRAKDIIGTAIQRCAADHVAETTVSVVELPNDEMKGRIIGREGRNIRAFEALAGVDLIIDDTPEAVVVSAFDPIRREKARIALEKLVADGRIHPARIEEMYEKAESEVLQVIREEGQQACYDTGVHNLHPELVKLLGRLKFRTSYGQNVLKHSIEVAYLAGIMAGELGLDVDLARRAGLLHDIGKAVDHEYEGTHVSIGIELLKKYGESEAVIDGMAAHHGDFEAKSVVAILVAAADALSAARPGARRETLEAYIRRLQKLEEIAESMRGVEKSFAIQAGREVRIIVKPDKVSDSQAVLLARDIVKEIQAQVDYPGQIKVTVIRETRAVEYAR